MTALPRATGADTELLVVCDLCGAALRARSTPIRAFTLIWTAARDVGWKGFGRPVGPHYCPRCTASTADV